MSSPTFHHYSIIDIADPRPEDELLICCSRTVIDKETNERIRALLRKDINWSCLVQLAVHHRVVPLLFQNLKQTDQGAIPTEILYLLQSLYFANAARNQYCATELIKLINWFAAQRISAIPYKGVSLSVLAYGNLCLRQFGDLDILVRSRDYSHVQHLLIASGYRLDVDWGWECSLIDNGHRLHVDLHKEITPAEFPIRLDFNDLWKRLKPVSTPVGSFKTICPEDMLIILCIQLAKDGWGEGALRLSKVCDIAELLRANPGIQYHQVLKQSKKLGCQRILSLGLTIAHELMQAPVAELFTKLKVYPNMKILVAHVKHKLFHQADQESSAQLSRDSFHYQLRERWIDKLYPRYYDFKVRLKPNEADQSVLRLPEQLGFIYYIIRPIRLIIDYGRLMYRKIKTGLTWKGRH